MLALLLACIPPGSGPTKGQDSHTHTGTTDTEGDTGKTTDDTEADDTDDTDDTEEPPNQPKTREPMSCNPVRLGDRLTLQEPVGDSWRAEACADGSLVYSVAIDIDGDLAMDRVAMMPCDNVLRFSTGASDWSEQNEWTLPAELPRHADGSVDGTVSLANLDGECGKDLVFRSNSGALKVFPQTPSGFGSPYTYTSWVPGQPGDRIYETCPMNSWSVLTDASWIDMDGDGDDDVWIQSDECDLLGGHGKGWIPSKTTKLTGKGQVVALPDSGFQQALNATPNPGREIVWSSGGSLRIWELHEGEYDLALEYTIEDGTGGPTGESRGTTAVAAAPCGDGRGYVYLRDLDGDGWADLHLDGDCDGWWQPGSTDGFGERIALEPTPWDGPDWCGETQVQLDAGFGAFALKNKCEDAESGLGTEFVQVIRYVD